MTADDRSRFVGPAESALTDLEGILHALDIIRFEDAINKPGPELHALNVLIQMGRREGRGAAAGDGRCGGQAMRLS
jgi:hypothetical protein